MDLTSLDNIEASASAFDRPTETMTDALSLLYQSGYLTIKSHDRDFDTYQLGIPNREVRVGLSEHLLLSYTNRSDLENGTLIQKFCRALLNEDLESALIALRAYLAGIPYPEGGKDILEDMEKCEYYYETIFYLLFSFMNRHIQTQVKTSRGRADMVMHTRKAIYVFELKINKSAELALRQIDEKGYMIPFTADERKLIKCGINFSTTTRTIDEWIIKEE